MAESIHGSDTLTLKALLESQSLFNPHFLCEEINPDKKKCNSSEEVWVGPNGMSADMAAAFLGPTIWDRTLPYDDLKLEYMDLNEFLSENGIPVLSETELGLQDNNNVQTNQHNQATTENKQNSAEQRDLPETMFNLNESTSTMIKPQQESTTKDKSPTYPSREPSPVKVNVDFEPSITDVALATIPGQDTFDPRTASFNDDELKPQPMIKKSRKVYVPDDEKDGKYWERRRKNNFAAKRSRDARRVKENQIAICAKYLLKENNAYKFNIQSLKKENLNLKKIIEKYETEMKLLNSLVG